MNNRYRSLEVNLLPASALSTYRQYRPYIFGAVLYVIVFFALVITGAVANWIQDGDQQTVDQLQSEINSLQAKMSETTNLGSVNDYLKLPDNLNKEKVNGYSLMSDFHDLLPDGMNVQTFELTDNRRINFNASFASLEILIGFMNRLRSNPNFEWKSSSGFSNVPAVAESAGQQAANRFSPITQVSFEMTYKVEEELK